jgi:Cysteine synthase
MSTAVSAASPSPTAPARSASADLVENIGQTPLLRLDRVADDLPETVTVYAKAEHLNPGGSVKDRPALRMIETGLASGAFRPDQTLIDATSGNTGIAYAMVGAAKGLDVTLALPQNASAERKRVLRAYGAELILTDPMTGTDGAQERVKEIVAAHPDRYFYPDQYNNDANWQAHYDGTGARFWSRRRPCVPLRHGPRHHRHVYGRDAPPEGARRVDPVCGRRARHGRCTAWKG